MGNQNDPGNNSETKAERQTADDAQEEVNKVVEPTSENKPANSDPEKGNNHNRGNDGPFSERVILVMVTSFLSLLAAFGGALFSANIERSVWARNTSYQFQYDVFTKRIELFERTLKIVNSVDKYQSLVVLQEINLELLEEYSKEEPLTAETRTKMKDVYEEIRSNQDEMESLSNELAVVLALDAAYFGPETKASIDSIGASPNWWEIDQEKFKSLLNSLQSELWYGLESRFIPDFAEKFTRTYLKNGRLRSNLSLGADRWISKTNNGQLSNLYFRKWNAERMARDVREWRTVRS